MTSQRKHTRLLALGLAAFLFVFTLAACGDSNFVTNTDDEATSTELTDLAARLSTDLGLSIEQTNRVNDLLAVSGDEKPEPGHLWTVAAELQQTLTDEQKARLFENVEQRRAEFAEGRQGRRFNRDGQGQGRRSNRDGQGQGRRFQRQGENGWSFLNDFLTPEQQEAMKTLREANRAEMKTLVEARQNGSLTDEDFREQAKALREANREAMQNLLTDEQKATLEQKHEEMKARVEAHKDDATAARVEALGLTADQEVALAEMRQAHRAEAKTLIERAHAGDLDRETVRTEMQTLREANKAALADVLTPEQIEITDIHNALRGSIAARRSGRRGGSKGVRGTRGFRGQNG